MFYALIHNKNNCSQIIVAGWTQLNNTVKIFTVSYEEKQLLIAEFWKKKHAIIICEIHSNVDPATGVNKIIMNEYFKVVLLFTMQTFKFNTYASISGRNTQTIKCQLKIRFYDHYKYFWVFIPQCLGIKVHRSCSTPLLLESLAHLWSTSYCLHSTNMQNQPKRERRSAMCTSTPSCSET